MRPIFNYLIIIAAGVMVVHYWPTIRPYLLADPLGDLQKFSQTLLVPIESPEVLDPGDAQDELAKLTSEVERQQSTATYPRAHRALQLLEQASSERNLYLQRARTDTSHHALDEVPGEWHVAGHPEQHLDLSQANREVNSSFWTQVARKQWRDRSEQYRAALAPIFNSEGN
ncbi:MAG: hypothetical protein QM796_01805 [Chthoniobacteraceae bacterium]